MKGLQKIKLKIDALVSITNSSELEVIEALEKFYINKAVMVEIKRYKKRKEKVAQITKDLKISHRRFYKIIEEKNIIFTKYKKVKTDT